MFIHAEFWVFMGRLGVYDHDIDAPFSKLLAICIDVEEEVIPAPMINSFPKPS
jgi:hypothetical protein